MTNRLFGTPSSRANTFIGALSGAWVLAVLWIALPDHDLLKALWSQTMAAWVQAIGSIGAIAIAIWVAADQAARTRSQVREAELDLEYRELSTLCIFALGCVESGDTFRNRCLAGTWMHDHVDYQRRVITRLLTGFSSVHLRSLPTEISRKQAVALTVALETLITGLNTIERHLPKQPPRNSFSDTVVDIKARVAVLNEELATAATRVSPSGTPA